MNKAASFIQSIYLYQEHLYKMIRFLGKVLRLDQKRLAQKANLGEWLQSRIWANIWIIQMIQSK